MREVYCRSEDVIFYHQGRVAIKLQGSWFKDSEWSEEDHQRRLQQQSLHSRRSCTGRKTFSRRGKLREIIHEYFRVSDTDESVLDLNEMLKVELENDNVHSFDTRWDVTVVAMKKQPLRGNSEKFRTATAVTASAHSSYCSTR